MPANVNVKPAPDRRCFYTSSGPEIEGDYFRPAVLNDLIESQIASGDLLVEKVTPAPTPAPAPQVIISAGVQPLSTVLALAATTPALPTL